MNHVRMYQVEVAEGLCKRWMHGHRKNSQRAAWEHPADIVKLIQSAPASVLKDADLQDMFIQIAWLHDVLEDGKEKDGSPVGPLDLLDNGITEVVAHCVQELTKKKKESKPDYLMRLRAVGSYAAKLVKFCDRICNLREGADTRNQDWWNTYVGETLYFIWPMLDNFDDATKIWLRGHLQQALNRREIKV